MVLVGRHVHQLEIMTHAGYIVVVRNEQYRVCDADVRAISHKPQPRKTACFTCFTKSEKCSVRSVSTGAKIAGGFGGAGGHYFWGTKSCLCSVALVFTKMISGIKDDLARQVSFVIRIKGKHSRCT